MSTCTLIPSTSGVVVHSPYNREFAYSARQFVKAVGGTWDAGRKVWIINASLDAVRALCAPYYTEVTQADAIPVPAVPEAQPDFGFYGTIGQSVTLNLEITKTVDCNGAYGVSRLHIMKDAEGKVFTWFASTARYEAGSAIVLQGKIKSHTPYNGVSQTVLTRCKKVG